MDRLAKLLSKTHTSCYAWMLITKHAHFLFRTGNVALATLIKRLFAGYAVSFNHAFSGTTSVMVSSFSPRHRRYAVEKEKAIAGENNYQLTG